MHTLSHQCTWRTCPLKALRWSGSLIGQEGKHCLSTRAQSRIMRTCLSWWRSVRLREGRDESVKRDSFFFPPFSSHRKLKSIFVYSALGRTRTLASYLQLQNLLDMHAHTHTHISRCQFDAWNLISGHLFDENVRDTDRFFLYNGVFLRPLQFFTLEFGALP